MGSTQYASLIDVVCAIACTLTLLPLILYLFRAWADRRDELFGYLDPDSLILYYKQFYPAKNLDPKLDLRNEFKRDFARKYGRRHYILPIVLLAALAVWCTYAAARTLQVSQKVAPGAYALPWIIASALAGGFAWVISDLISRLRRRDFTVSDIYNWVFRILVAGPFGWAFAQTLKENIGVPLAFLLGAFPTTTLFTISRRLVATRLGVSDDASSGALELQKLQSITRTNAERFYDEGVSTIVQLAYSDPVDLTIRTNFSFNYVIDCVSQALLWIYLEEKTSTLAIYSLRGAQEAAYLVQSLANSKTQAQAMATLSAIAGALSLSAATLQTTLEEVANDPYTRFIYSIWH